MTRADHQHVDAPTSRVSAGRSAVDAQQPHARADQHHREPHWQAVSAGHELGESQSLAARADDLLVRIRTLAEVYEDLQRARVGNSNRIGSGLQLPQLQLIQDGLEGLEHKCELELCKLWRKHPLAPWAAGIPGLGEKTMARIVAHIGDPADRRNPAKLWRYCGLDPTTRRRKGMTEDEARLGGNQKVKALLLNPDTGVAAQIVRQRPPIYRDAYDVAKAKYVAGRPDWPLIRCERAARRVAVKLLIRDLWVEAWRLRTESTGQPRPRPRTGADSGRGKESQRRHQLARR